MSRKRTHAGARPVRKGKKIVGYRAEVRDPLTGQRVSANKVLGLRPGLYPNATEASSACHDAEALLAKRSPNGNVTVAVLRERWLAQSWKKDSTRQLNEQRTRKFCERHANKPAALVTEQDWFAERDQHDGKPAHLEALKAMFNWGASSDGSRVIGHSPFSGLRVAKKKGNARKNPPTEAEIEQLLEAAYNLLPGFGAWLEFACFTGARPGEIDALKWSDLSKDGSEIRIRRQWSAASSKFTLPKNGLERTVILNLRAKHAIERARQLSSGEYVFTNTQGQHWRTATRAWWWKAAAATVTWEREQPTLYLATRHFAGWFMLNKLHRPTEEIAQALGHTDGGDLVRKLYGHLDEAAAKRRIADAYDDYFRQQRADRKRNFRAIEGGGEA